jgi:hypothetical protein
MKFKDRFFKPNIVHPPKHFANNIFPEAVMLPSNVDVVLWKSSVPVSGTIFVENQNFSDDDISDTNLIINIQCSDGNDIIETLEKGRQLMITALNMESLAVKFEETDNKLCVIKYGISIHHH